MMKRHKSTSFLPRNIIYSGTNVPASLLAALSNIHQMRSIRGEGCGEREIWVKESSNDMREICRVGLKDYEEWRCSCNPNFGWVICLHADYYQEITLLIQSHCCDLRNNKRMKENLTDWYVGGFLSTESRSHLVWVFDLHASLVDPAGGVPCLSNCHKASWWTQVALWKLYITSGFWVLREKRFSPITNIYMITWFTAQHWKYLHGQVIFIQIRFKYTDLGLYC